MDVPACKTRREIGGLAEHAVTFVGAGDGETDALDLRPFQAILREKFVDTRNPAADDGLAPALRIGRPLKNPGGDSLAVFPDGGDF